MHLIVLLVPFRKMMGVEVENLTYEHMVLLSGVFWNFDGTGEVLRWTQSSAQFGGRDIVTDFTFLGSLRAKSKCGCEVKNGG